MVIEERPKLRPQVYRREEHSISRKNIDPDALKVMRRLMRHGYKAYLVGGSVRDLLLGKKPKDFDIVTDATPRRIKSLFRNCRIIGRRFKLAHIYFGNGKIFEVSTFRAGHEADVEMDEKELLITRDNIYGDEQSDALRRDVTINALFYALRNFSVIDYIGGMEDLKAGVVRVIGDPGVRFAEDPVRMMRVVRHAVRAGFRIDDASRDAIAAAHASILNCSEVRLYEELKKDLTSGFSIEILQGLSTHGLLQHLVPELAEREDLLFGRSFFARCMKRVDAIALDEGLDGITAILALIALFTLSGDPENPDPAELFSSAGGSAERLQSCFRKLAVPRKERERIAGVLELWRYIETTAADALSGKRVAKDPAYQDVKTLLRFLNVDRRAEHGLDVLTTAQEKRSERGRPHHGRRGRGYGRGGRRRIKL